ncbi:MAG: DMT family transporter [Actinomycetota bacterium]
MTRKQIAEYALVALVWGLSFLVLLKVVKAFGWVGAVTFRTLLAGLLLTVAARATGRRLDFSIGWRPFFFVGLTAVAIQLIGLSFAAPRIGTAMSAIFVGTIPLYSMVIGRLWGTETINRQGAVGLVIGFSGMVVLVGFPAVAVTGSFVLGCVSSVVSCIASAIGSNFARRRLAGVGEWEQSIGSFLFGGAMTLPLIFAVPVPTTPRPVDYLFLLMLAGFVSALGYVVFFRLVAQLGATKAISVEFIVTVIAVVAGSVVLDERLSVAQLIGTAIILTGCALVLGLIGRRPAQA